MNQQRVVPSRLVRVLVLLAAMLITSGIVVIGSSEGAAAKPPSPVEKAKKAVQKAVTGSDGECKPPDVPDHAGSGLPGVIDDQTKSKNPNTFYGQYGWAGLRWPVCDLTKAFMGLPTSESTKVSVSTWIGNGGLAVGTFWGALCTQGQQWDIDPGSLIGPIDKFTGKITNGIAESTWYPYAAVVIILAGIGIIFNAVRGEVRNAAKTFGAVVLAIFAIAWVTTPAGGKSGPEHVGSLFDEVATKINGDVTDSTAKWIGARGNSTDETIGFTMQDKILYKIWTYGAVGSDSAHRNDAQTVYTAGTVPWSGVQNMDAEKKRGEFNGVAQGIKKKDPAEYDQLRGVAGGRAGYGALAAVDMTLVAIPRLPTIYGQLAGLVGLRVLVMIAPVLALLACWPATRRIAWSAVKWGLGALAMIAMFGVLAELHTLIVGAAATYSPNMGVLTGILAVTAAVFVALTVALVSRAVRATGELAKDTGRSVIDAPGRFAYDVRHGATAIPESIYGSVQDSLEPARNLMGRLGQDEGDAEAEAISVHSSMQFRDALMPPIDNGNAKKSEDSDDEEQGQEPDRDSSWDDAYYFFDSDYGQGGIRSFDPEVYHDEDDRPYYYDDDNDRRHYGEPSADDRDAAAGDHSNWEANDYADGAAGNADDFYDVGASDHDDQDDQDDGEFSNHPAGHHYQMGQETVVEINLPDNDDGDGDDDQNWFTGSDDQQPQQPQRIDVTTHSDVSVEQASAPAPVYSGDHGGGIQAPQDGGDGGSGGGGDQQIVLNNSERIHVTMQSHGGGNGMGGEEFQSEELDADGNLAPVFFHPPRDERGAA